ncbi:MAG: DUF4163 domain-containing protein [Clostridiaceae bacterium]
MINNLFLILVLSSTITFNAPKYTPYIKSHYDLNSINQSVLKLSTEKSDSTNLNKTNLNSEYNHSYELISSLYSIDDIHIKYPQLINLGDKNKQSIINDLIKTDALKVLNYYKNSTHDLTLEIDYTIKRQDLNILSLQYSGIGYIKGAAHPNNLLYTTNININTGKKLRLKDIVNIDKNLISKFINGDLKPLNPYVDYTLSNFSTEELLKTFENADSLSNTGSENYSDVFSYLTKDSLGISMNVSHAVGDHTEFEIKLKDIKNNIKEKTLSIN